MFLVHSPPFSSVFQERAAYIELQMELEKRKDKKRPSNTSLFLSISSKHNITIRKKVRKEKGDKVEEEVEERVIPTRLRRWYYIYRKKAAMELRRWLEGLKKQGLKEIADEEIKKKCEEIAKNYAVNADSLRHKFNYIIGVDKNGKVVNGDHHLAKRKSQRSCHLLFFFFSSFFSRFE